jgi:hypothetical protein
MTKCDLISVRKYSLRDMTYVDGIIDSNRFETRHPEAYLLAMRMP